MRMPTRRHVLVAIFLAFVLFVGFVALALAIAQDQETLRIRTPMGAEDRRTPAYVSALVGAALSEGNTYEILTNGDQIFPAMLAAINGATRRISLATYIYDKGQVADQFTAALEAAARRGVRVSIVVDHFGSSPMDDVHVDRLRRAGCRLASFNPAHWYSLEEVNYRTHRKILVVDGRTAFIGGAGVADQWLGHAQDKGHWRDTQIRMRGPIVRLIEGAFYEDYAEDQDIVTPELDDVVPELDADGQGLVVSSAAAGGGINDLKRLYLLSIALARRTIDIETPYFLTDESTSWALEDAVSRGVKVRLLVEGDLTDAMAVKYASRDQYERLLSIGVEIHEYQPTMMHAKTMVVDGVWSMFGSANFDNRSLELNDELNVAVWNRRFASRLKDDYEEDLRRSVRLDLEQWRRRSPLVKARERFWSYFSEIF